MDYRLATLSPSGIQLLARLIFLHESIVLAHKILPHSSEWIEGSGPFVGWGKVGGRTLQWHIENKTEGGYRLEHDGFLDIKDLSEEEAAMILFQVGGYETLLAGRL